MAQPVTLSTKKYDLYIDGHWRPASDGATLETHNPATGEKLADIAEASQADVDAAAVAARKAFHGWARTGIPERSAILLHIADVIEDNLDYLAAIETMDNGKPIRETTGADLPLAVDHFRYFAGVIRGDEGSANVLPGNLLNLILREPLGVVGQIVPWNFPFLMAAWKLAPALAAGDTVLFKPSSATSLSVLELARLIAEAEILPPGVLNILTGSGAKSGEYILKADVDKLAFTGSTEVGREIARAAAEKIIPSTLELGGKSANVFFADADIDLALEGVGLGILFNQGQVCSAGSRIFVDHAFYDEFMGRVVDEFKKVRVGDPLDPQTQMGAQVNEKQLDKILNYVHIGQEEGATVAVGGERLTEGAYGKGAFLEPTLLADVDNKMRVAQEEIFGPVGVVIPFKDEDDVIRMANDSVYGLGGGVFTNDISKALRVAGGIRTGRVWVNTYNQFPAGAPFGGYKESGIGRETHKSILDAYSQTKNVLVNLNKKPGGFYVEG
ncbi:aldehyde dehydrogenase family protein [Raineyella sp. W15-4]|uniref:aldehyde dehydrogenase family protein n=1 Tax=Raineyella sp. W15-4 TaxID=3081651 RepID=UPI00295329EB|nr:aldehyde dehydrogenase family protein [Raineyella sp. W15-4]WOQ16478.1 aldehyde dehydrogenase family protein [Raineyella sp. W15-4]